MMKSKIHRACVTESNLEYEGSITIDRNLCRHAKMLEYEKVSIYNCNTGGRLSTYVIYGNKGTICLNGAAARLAQKNDKIIIVSYARMNEKEASLYKPQIILVDEQNEMKLSTLENQPLSI